MNMKDYDSPDNERWSRTSESNKERKIVNKRFKDAHNPWAPRRVHS